ncbi:MAG: DUF2073 domain-containing protein [Candidatus Woesearchaeota archaeon]
MGTYDRIDFLMSLIRDNRILLIEGRLKPEEEGLLIQESMRHIDATGKHFSGIEITVLHESYRQTYSKIQQCKKKIAAWLLENKKESMIPHGITIIGPALIIKEMKQSPEILEMHLQKIFLKKTVQQQKGKS